MIFEFSVIEEFLYYWYFSTEEMSRIAGIF